MHAVIAATSSSSSQVCCICGKDYPPFQNRHDEPSTKCQHCYEKQQEMETKRATYRSINYGERKERNEKSHIAEYFRRAMKKGLQYELTPEQFRELVRSPCYYCGVFTEGRVIGIDRFDNSKGYIYSNCRPCCEICNRMKVDYHPLFFIEKCKAIANCLSDLPEFFTKWDIYYTRLSPLLYSQYTYEASRRGYSFELTRLEFNSIIRNPCYLCKFPGPCGIDRCDDVSLSSIVEKAIMISHMWTNTSSVEFPPMPAIEKVPERRKTWRAESLYDALMSNRVDEFIVMNRETVTMAELDDLRDSISCMPTEDAISRLRTFLNTVNLRRKRSTPNIPSNTDISAGGS